MSTRAALVFVALFPAVALAQRPQQQQQREEGAAAAARYEVAGAAEEKISQTQHTIRVDGRELRYTATAGTLPIRLDEGKVVARMFFAGYTKDGENPKGRPLAFLYNGGPGAASVYLHMGSFAPRRVQMSGDGFQPSPPYQLVDNDHTLLDGTRVGDRSLRRGRRRACNARVSPARVVRPGSACRGRCACAG